MTSLRILYDGQTFAMQKRGGISRYFTELAKNIPNTTLAVEQSENVYLAPFLPPEARVAPQDSTALALRLIEAGQFDVFHPTYYNLYFLEKLLWTRKPFVLTVHDLIHERFPELFSANDATLACKRLLMPRAKRIICVSENTQKDLLAHYPVDPKIVSVIHHGPPFEGLAPGPQTVEFPGRSILYVGNRGSYKNFAFFWHTLLGLLEQQKDLRLVCVGGGEWRGEAHAQVVHYPHLSESDLFHAYQNAQCFVFPSLYEGFGLPILEAWAAGCPCVLANASCFPEIGGEAALYFDPHSQKELLQSISSVLENSELKNELILKGKERLKAFSWSKCAAEHLACYGLAGS
jgi:glycosyltransferase involved in cell wall biosynthesis